MNKIIAIAGSSASGIVCCVAAWKICEAGLSAWPWFLLTGILIMFLSAGLARLDEEENKEIDI